MLDFIYHMTLKLLEIVFFCMRTQRFCHIYDTLLGTSIHKVTKICTTSGLSISMHGVISFPDATSYDKFV